MKTRVHDTRYLWTGQTGIENAWQEVAAPLLLPFGLSQHGQKVSDNGVTEGIMPQVKVVIDVINIASSHPMTLDISGSFQFPQDFVDCPLRDFYGGGHLPYCGLRIPGNVGEHQSMAGQKTPLTHCLHLP